MSVDEKNNAIVVYAVTKTMNSFVYFVYFFPFFPHDTCIECINFEMHCFMLQVTM